MNSSLLKIKSFLPYIIITFINVVVDIAHKITIQNTVIKMYDGGTLIVLSAIINSLMLIPFVMFFSPSGFISDKYSKAIVIRYASFAAIIITALITVSYIMGLWYLAFGLTVMLAIQAAIYSPAKYGIIKEIVGEENLGEANGFIQAITITAILLSGLCFSIIFEMFYSPDFNSPNMIIAHMVPIGIIMVVLSFIEFILSFRLPIKAGNQSNFSFSKYINFVYLKQNIKTIYDDKSIFRSIMGLAFFWGIGQLLISTIPAHYKAITNDSNAVTIQIIMALSAVGIMLGSFIAGKLSKKRIELGIVPIGAIGIFLSLLILSISHSKFSISMASLLFGFFGGFFIVPLNALIQFLSPQKQLGVILAGNNFIQNIFMILFLFFSIIVVEIGFSSSLLFFIASILSFFVSLFVIKQVPHLFARIMLLPILKTRYKFTLHGLENLPSRGGVLMLGNHISWIDWLILQSATPRPIKFVMHKHFYEKWYIKWILDFFHVIPISSTGSKKALEAIKERLDNGEVVALFPEGRISFNGQMNEFKKGFEISIADTDHPILPFYIHGLWGSAFSKANRFFKSMIRKGDNRDVIVVFGPQLSSSTQAHEVKQKVVELSHYAWEASANGLAPLTHSWLRRAKAKPFKRSIVDTQNDLNNLQVMIQVFLSAKKLKLIDGENIGILLPTSSSAAIINMAILAIGKKAVNLNYALGSHCIENAVTQAEVEKIITSKKFMRQLSSEGFDFNFIGEENMIKIEDMSKPVNKKEKVSVTFEALCMPKVWLKWRYFMPISMEDTAIIHFSSKNDGASNGVELTHKNIMTNIKQVSALLQFQENDVILNSLPIFHLFGLNVMTLLPLCEGIGMISISDPSDCAAFGKLAARFEATIMFGASEFFRLYTLNDKLHPLMLKNIRMIATAAEKLEPELKRGFKEKFGLDIYEGYGTIETSPVIAVNMANALDLETMKIIIGNKDGSVGQAIPGTIIKIVDPITYEEVLIGKDGLILVGGAQVMKGYLNDPVKTKDAIIELDGVRYYKTGDKGHIDKDGFITLADLNHFP
ncbi:MAG: acyl-[ACP]--phospholipid O-acyltransferase [Sulfurovaceae bacterium]|nr:acyl-[ACP]--phospholipid O-acyltransferase [Sulfurovaceae bacterium]